MPTPKIIMLKGERKLLKKLNTVTVRMYNQLLRDTRKIINSKNPEKALTKLELSGQDDYAKAVYNSSIDMFYASHKKTEKAINRRRRNSKRTLAVSELTGDEKASADRLVGQEYAEWADSLAGKKWEETVVSSKDVIRKGITEGWGMKARYEYRFQDGSKASYNDSKKFPTNVSRVQVKPGLRDELAKVVKKTSNPEAVARTEMTRAYNDGVVKGAIDDEFVKGFQFLGVNDERQSDICNYLDGTIIDKLDPRVDAITPPLHVYCRSRLIEVMVTSDKKANIDTRTIKVDGVKKRVADLDTRFGKAGLGEKAFNTPVAKAERVDLGIPNKGLVIREPEAVRNDFINSRPNPNLVALSSGLGIKKATPKGTEEPSKVEPDETDLTPEEQQTKKEAVDSINDFSVLVSEAGPIENLSPEVQKIIDDINNLSK